MKKCFNCFCEYESEDGICPFCGCDPSDHTDLTDSLRPETDICGCYQLGYAIKRDSFGFCYRAFDKRGGNTVTVGEYMSENRSQRDEDGKRVRFSGDAGDFAKKAGEIISFADRL